MKKFMTLVHYIIHECANPDQLGAIRLNKILWFSDVIAYREYGKAITNESYVKRQFGPVPQRILSALKALEKAGSIVIREPSEEYEARKFISLKAPETKLLTNRETQIASAVLNGVMGYTANQVSELSHDDMWRAAREGERIPLSAMLGAPGEVTDDVLTWAADAFAAVQDRAQA